MNKEANDVIAKLYDPLTIRLQAHRVLELARENKLDYFNLDETKLEDTVAFIIDVICSHYPDLNIPYHSRWRHFEVGDIDRIKLFRNKLTAISSIDLNKILFELVIISVFLDAGAGPLWHYQEENTGCTYTRSEGLALASLALYQSGALSAQKQSPYRIDAERLLQFSEEDLQRCFQIHPNNPLEGISGRVSLLNRLGTIIKQKPQYFGNEARLGNFYLHIDSLQRNHMLSATSIFQAVLQAFNDIWPSRIQLQGTSLGDVGIHHKLKTHELGSEYIPFHKLSQWLTYSLIEPLEQAGINISDIDLLTGLPEYRNGGLLLDMGLLKAKNKEILLQPHNPSSEIIVEWRALTVALLDEVAKQIRTKLQKNATELPLAKILQGGTWEAGRKIANQLRPQGTPPIQIISDGTVF